MASIQKKRRKRGGRKRISPQERKRQLIQRIALTAGLLALFVILLFAADRLLFRKHTTDKQRTIAASDKESNTAKKTDITAPEEEADSPQEPMEPTASPEPDVPDYVKNKPDIDISSWEYILANSDHSIRDYRPDVEEFEGVYLDTRVIDAMARFVQDTRAQGLEVVMTSGYRSYDTQADLFEKKVAEYGDEDVAATIVARPGTSEHQTGLAADICDDYYQYMNESLENTETYKWMSTHCQDYGFIVRFPKDKEDVTGIIYEPWHYRYVGPEAAKYIMQNNLTLEEFVSLYQ